MTASRGSALPRKSVDPSFLPPEVRTAASVLADAGGQAFVVGGAIRDHLLGREVHDWDLATDLTPDQLTGLFPRTREVGAQFGTVLVQLEHGTYEVTTFRRDGLYSDGRRPDSVEYSKSVEDDLQRRDLTINAFAYNVLTDELIDLFAGRQDLVDRRLRMVGDPEVRFEEDALRLLRVVRFAAELGFEIERETLRALTLLSPTIERVSGERVLTELRRIVLSPRAAHGFEILFETGLLRRILPELDRCYGVAQNGFHSFSVFHHCLAAVDQAGREEETVRWAALFHDVGKPETREQLPHTATFYGHQQRSERHVRQVFDRLRAPKAQREDVAHLVLHHMFHYTPDWTDGAVRRFMKNVGVEHVDALFRLRAADTMGNGSRKRVAPELGELRRRIEAILAAENALSLKDLAVNGRDLMDSLGVAPGPKLGSLLEDLLQEVLERPEANERSYLLKRARELHDR